jgi:hypothetical protein
LKGEAMLFEPDELLMERAVHVIEDVGKIHALITGFARKFDRSPNRSAELKGLIDHSAVMLNEASRALADTVTPPM